MNEGVATRIGAVRHVLGAQITVAIDPNMAGVAPIYRGKLQAIGQIGSLVRVPQGLVDLVGQVTLLGIAEVSTTDPSMNAIKVGERWLQVQLLGEINRTNGVFYRGVSSYPGLDDAVHFATSEQLGAIFPHESDEHLRMGHLSASEDVSVCLDVGRLVLRHTAIVGSTGSGKSSTVARFLQGLSRGGWPSANVVVIDPHGEYAKALKSEARVSSVLDEGADRVRVPFWALRAVDILGVFTGTTSSAVAQNRFAELVKESRLSFLAECDWLKLDPAAVTADTPIPFDLKSVWHKLDRENRETRTVKEDPGTACVISEGDPEGLVSSQFQPYALGSASPFKAPSYSSYGATPDLLRLGMNDPCLAFFMEPRGDPKGSDPLVEVIEAWLGHDKPISVMSFSGVPVRASELAIGVILELLFEISLRSDLNDANSGVGRSRPLLIVLEEAHRYLSDSAPTMARRAANRIAREGRKYGVGLLLVTQRPSELPDTALAQCGTLIAMRLTNAGDQSKIRAALPDSVAGLSMLLPALRTGEAIIVGESILLPARCIIDLPHPLPDADDPPLSFVARARFETGPLRSNSSMAEYV